MLSGYNPKPDDRTEEIHKNFMAIYHGLDKFYARKLDTTLPPSCVNISNLIETRSIDQMVTLLEFIFGAMVNCEEKEAFI